MVASNPLRFVTLNVGGKPFSTSIQTLASRDSHSMLARLVSGHLQSAKDSKGRILIDRDPMHFGLILNYLRDGSCVLPADEQQQRELQREAAYYQLDGLLASLSTLPLTSAGDFQASISQRIKADSLLQAALQLILECAFGSPLTAGLSELPARKACVDVTLRESAYDPLAMTLYIGSVDNFVRLEIAPFQGFERFSQHLVFRGPCATQEFRRTHVAELKTHPVTGAPVGYDQNMYTAGTGSAIIMKVWKHHCIDTLSQKHRHLRDCVMHAVHNQTALKWALELAGYREVGLNLQAFQQRSECDADSGPTPVFCNVRFSIHLSL
ncbi:hypothetical protein WJX72_008587 [[Myrmecia] bisecta]|uniref:BTB domain-containing protein n=1 Tax=[Myrmecia] bisecta TaxID=41462 RepID=A0AAW1QRU2_9CHLO